MRRIQYHRYGSPAVLQLADIDDGTPGRGEILVKVVAAAAKAMDWKIRRGDMRLATGRRLPRGVGQDLAGTVLEVGPGVDRFVTGDAVFGAAGFAAGAFGETVVVKAKHLTHKPEGLLFEQAATLPVIGLTALQALNRAEIGAGHRVFIGGAQGGVGQVAAQRAAHRGASVAGSARDAAAVGAAGLPVSPVVPFDFDPSELAHGFDLVFDTTGKIPTTTSRRLVKRGGQVLDIVPSPTRVLRALRYREYRMHMGSLKTVDLDLLGVLVTSGTLHVAIARTVPLDRGIEALTELEEYGTPKGGKLVVTP